MRQTVRSSKSHHRCRRPVFLERLEERIVLASFQGLGADYRPITIGINGPVSVPMNAISSDGTKVIAYRLNGASVGAVWMGQGSDIGDLPGGAVNSVPYAISSDGSTVIGQSHSGNGTEAMAWRADRGAFGLGDIPGGDFESRALSVSSDGSVIVGNGETMSGQQAFRWTEASGIVGLGSLPGGLSFSRVSAVSANGAVVIGESRSANGFEAFRWTENGGLEGLGDLPGGEFFSDSLGISNDGSVIVGHGSSNGGPEAFRWTSSTGMVALGDLPGGNFRSIATDLSPTGDIVMGTGTSTLGTEGFIWKQDTGMVGLGDLPGGDYFSEPTAMSADGSILVGQSASGSSNREAFVWTNADGIRTMRAVLNELGVTSELSGWTLTQALDLSEDGKTVVGLGTNPNGVLEGWIADLSDAIPDDADVSIEHVELTGSKRLSASFIIEGSVEDFPVAVYRSSDELFDVNDELVVERQVITAAGADSVFNADIHLDSALMSIEAKPYVLVVVDPDLENTVGTIPELDEGNNVFAFHMNSIQRGIDRWWGTAGSGESFDVTWITDIKEEGVYEIGINLDSKWELTPGAQVLHDSSAYTLNHRFNDSSNSFRTEAITLSRGLHFFHISKVRTPNDVGISEISFFAAGIAAHSALFIADHREASIPLSESEKRELAQRFAPILHFNEGERFPFPFDAEQSGWNRYENKQRITGAADEYIDLSCFEPFPTGEICSIADAASHKKIYASITPRQISSHLAQPQYDSLQVAVSYHFYYPRSNWSEVDNDGFNTHEGDWEGVTVFLQRIDDQWTPQGLALANHLSVHEFEWNDATLTNERPHIFVGLGGHASYIAPGVTRVFVPSPQRHRTESHLGDGQIWGRENPDIEYLPRAADRKTKDWMLYPGLWGADDLGDLFGDAGPRGPMFIELLFDGGPRWLDPWRWAEIQPGDVDENGVVGIEDIDSVAASIRESGFVKEYDLNRDSILDSDDWFLWLDEILDVRVGDSNLDGVFDSNDIIRVFQSGGYEDDISGNGSWREGDWDGDGDFSSSDIIAAFQFGTYTPS